MWKIYIKLTIRSLQREKAYVLINLLGFSTGLACFLAAALFLFSELRYDQHFANHENIYRIATERLTANSLEYTSLGSPQVGPTMLRDFPEVRSFVRFARNPSLELYLERNKRRDWGQILYTDANVFEVFSHNIIYGDPETALQNPLAIAISESFSNYYFGSENPVGRTISELERDYTVTLVFEDLPDNTHLKYDALLSWDTDHLDYINAEGRQGLALMFLSQTHYTYLQMVDDFEPSSFSEISEEYVESYLSDFVSEYGMTMNLSVEPLASIHFNSSTERDLPRGNRSSVLILAALATSVLVIACLNYVNLAVARSRKRANEVGMRKIFGATRAQLITQFLLETLAFILTALITGLGILFIASNFSLLAQLPGIVPGLERLATPAFIAGALLVCAAVAALTGVYPALMLARIKPLDAPGSSSRSNSLSASLGNGSLLAQLILSVVVISFTASMFKQLQYINEQPLGYNKFNKITIEVKGTEIIRRLSALISELESHNNIVGATTTNDLSSNRPLSSNPGVETEDGSAQFMNINHIATDANFIEVMDVTLLQGRNLDPLDRDEIGRSNLVNEAMVRQMGWTEPLGKRVGTWQVTGVVADFNFLSLHQQVEPMVIRLGQESLERASVLNGSRMRRTLVIHVSEMNISETLQYIQNKWNEFEPGQAFSYRFLDQSLEQLYRSDFDRALLIGAVSALCILISTLGTMTLSCFNAAQHTRDIGIRKVLGASSFHIIMLYFNRLLITIIGASLVGSLIAYALVNEWLRGFYYRDQISVAVFLLSVFLMFMVVFFSNAIQSYRGAQMPPSVSLRYE